jgi:DNA helicase-2/ATP-dependent DNA helicase PcrA
MSDTLALADIDIAGMEDHPADESVKLFGPPGTGKTTNAAARVARLIRDHGYDISDIAWITYRKSLAMDTLRRLSEWGVVSDKQMADPSDGSTKFIGTAHAVANRTVGGIGDPVEYWDKKQFCEQRNLKFDKTSPWDMPAGQLLFDVFDYAAKNLLDPTDKGDLRQVPAMADLREKCRMSVPRLYADWEEYKHENEVVDFWEMLEAPIDTNTSPGRSVLVIDEYHDAYPQLATLAEMWAEQADIVIVAGDPNQVVNNYDGADPSFYLRIDYPEILLPMTYRVPYEHWNPATWLLANAHDPPDIARQSRGTFGIQRSPGFRHTEEVGWNVPAPEEEHSPGWFVDKMGDDTMFLTRTTHQLDGVAKALERAGILFQVPTSSDTRDWAAGVGVDVSDRVAVYNALQKIRHLNRTSFDGVTYGLDQYDQNDTNPDNVVLSAIEAAALLHRSSAEYLAESRNDITEICEDWITDEDPVSATTINLYVEPDFWAVYTQGSASASQLNKTSKRGGKFNRRDFEALGTALRKNDSPVDGEISTKVFTIHAAKGNEAENVVVYDGVTKRIREAMDRDEDEFRNEWRTWYVAFTRASKRLFVLKSGFDFTKPFLPAGKKLKERARIGYENAEGVNRNE